MALISHGVDIIDVPRFAKLMARGDGKFGDRCFTKRELRIAAEYNTAQRLAGWFAVKEAVLKALGTGQANGAKFTDIEIFHNEAGAPYIKLSGSTKKLARELKIDVWLVSISHTEQIAIGSVIGTSEG